jgi:hypothetical protein
MLLSTLEAYDLVRFAEVFDARLATAEELLASRTGLEREKEWLTTALSLVRAERAPAASILERVRDLPELDEVREEYAAIQQNLWVDALEKLHAGITFCSGSRAPVIEALFPHLKFPQLRRASREAVQEFTAAYERRLKSAYVSRILAREDFAFVHPVVSQVATAYAIWQSCFQPSQLPEERAIPLRQELIALGKRLDVALRQARLLAEAALVPIPEAFESAGLSARPRKRSGRGLPLAAEESSNHLEPTSDAESLAAVPLEDSEPTVIGMAFTDEPAEPTLATPAVAPPPPPPPEPPPQPANAQELEALLQDLAPVEPMPAAPRQSSSKTALRAPAQPRSKTSTAIKPSPPPVEEPPTPPEPKVVKRGRPPGSKSSTRKQA